MPILSRTDVMQKLAAGKGAFSVALTAAGATISTAAAGSGQFSCQLRANAIGSTMPGTLVGFPLSAGMPDTTMLFATGVLGSNASHGVFIGFLYQLGTLVLTATGDQFTHHAATFPVTRTEMGGTEPIALIPLVQITTATATTAPVFRLRTAGGAAGYVNQDGTSVVGTKTMAMPVAATAAGSTYVFRLEEGDSAVRDITAVEVTTAGTAGAATIYGLEVLSATHIPNIYETFASDLLFGTLRHSDLLPATATSGTASAVLGALAFGSTTAVQSGLFFGVSNT